MPLTTRLLHNCTDCPMYGLLLRYRLSRQSGCRVNGNSSPLHHLQGLIRRRISDAQNGESRRDAAKAIETRVDHERELPRSHLMEPR